MKTINWQTKALTLFIAAAALWLATACTKEYPITYPSDGLRIISAEPCEIDVPLVPSPEFIRLREREDPDNEKFPTWDSFRSLPGYYEAQDERSKRIKSEVQRIDDVLETYRDRLRRYPYFGGSLVGLHFTWDGALTDRFIVEVYLDHLVDPRTVPPEDRIPGCIAGVPVHIVVGRTFNYPES